MSVIYFYYILFFFCYICHLICNALRFKTTAMTVAEGDICDVLWIVSKSFELIETMTFYGRLIKIIHSYFSLGWRRGNKSQMWNVLIRYTHCLITLVSITFVLQQVVNILVTKKMADEHSCGKKASLFPLATQIYFLCASRSEVNNGKYFPVSNTPSKALRDSPLWPVWASVQQGSQKLVFDSPSWPHTLMARCFRPSTRLTINCLRWWQPFISLGI